MRRRLLAALRQAVPARLPVIEATDKDAVGFYTANDFVTTSLSEKYLKNVVPTSYRARRKYSGIESSHARMRMPTAGEIPST